VGGMTWIRACPLAIYLSCRERAPRRGGKKVGERRTARSPAPGVGEAAE